jgi:hypothetical protein
MWWLQYALSGDGADMGEVSDLISSVCAGLHGWGNGCSPEQVVWRIGSGDR